MTNQKPDLIAAATEIAAAYVSRNHVAAADLPALIVKIHTALTALILPAHADAPEPEDKRRPTPSQVRKSITDDALISFIDGKRYKTLKRHISKHGFDADSYRHKYGLPRDYPMTAPSYSVQRAALAKGRDFGRGSKGRPKKAE